MKKQQKRKGTSLGFKLLRAKKKRNRISKTPKGGYCCIHILSFVRSFTTKRVTNAKEASAMAIIVSFSGR